MNKRIKSILYSIIATILSVALVVVFSACSSPSSEGKDISDNSITEGIVINDYAIEDYVVADEYVEELILIDEQITDLLMEDDSIEEVLLCRSIYINQDNIAEFSKNSGLADLFVQSIDWEALITKVAIGTGVILTLTVLRVVGIPSDVASSVITAAAEGAGIGAAIGAGVGSLTGALMGALNAIDETGRTASILGFSLAVVGVVLATVSLVMAIPSGGGTSITAAIGVKIAIAGVSLAIATAGAAYSGYNMVKTLIETDAADIDWENIDWEKVGVSAAIHAVEGAADGYMWGSVFGAVNGGAEGLEFYDTHGAPYSTYAKRLQQTPKEGERGHWTGERGESTYVLNEPITAKNGTVITEVPYRNAIPDFKKYQIARVQIRNMTDKRTGKGRNFEQANKELAKKWTKIKYNGKDKWTARDVSDYLDENNLVWHEMNNLHSMQLVPSEVNLTFGHLGGVSEYKSMTWKLSGWASGGYIAGEKAAIE